MATHLSLELKRILRRELKDMGENILKKQCRDKGIVWEEIEAKDLEMLTEPLSKAIIAFTGKEKADTIVKEIEKFKVLEELKLSKGEIAERVGRKKRMEVLLRLGDICMFIGEWDNSLRYLQEALELAKTLDIKENILKAMHEIGSVYLEMGNWEKAKECYEDELAIANQDEDAQAMAQRGLGKLAWRRGQFEKAKEYGFICIEYYAKMNDKRSLAYLYKDLGDVYGECGDYENGLGFYKKSISLLDSEKEIYNMANIYMNMGVVYSLKKDWKSAAEHYEKCIGLTEKEGYTNTMAWALFNVAEAYTKMKMIDSAEKALAHSVNLLEKTDDQMGIAGVNMKFGELYQDQKRYEEAIPYFERSIKTLKELGIPKYLADATHELGLTFAAMKRNGEAIEMYEEALATYKELGIEKSMKNVVADMEKLKET